jgi:hypothetical protein
VGALAYHRQVRPVTAIVIVILLVLIAGAALIQLWEIIFPPA